MSHSILEVCCASADSAVAAVAAGADRVELCDNLVEGGTTPSLGAAALTVERADVPVMAMIRPRGGDFLYSPLEFEVMLRDIDALGRVGVSGFVLGVLEADGRVDLRRTERLVSACRPLPVTFHRAIDLCRDPVEAVDAVAELGIARVLTSAGGARAVDHLDVLERMAQRAAGRLKVMAAGGVRAHDVERLLRVTGVEELHIGAQTFIPSLMTHRVPDVPMGGAYVPDEYRTAVLDTDHVASVARAIASRRGPVLESGRRSEHTEVQGA